MDKFKRVSVAVSLCIVAVAGALVGSHELGARAEHWIGLVGIAFGALGHVLPSVFGTPQPTVTNVIQFPAKEEVKP